MFVNGPQGAGKSTLTSALCSRFRADGKSAITISIDDFYLTRDAQTDLARSFPDNPYLQQRGYPGTHDIELGEKILCSFESPADPFDLLIPRYDKSAFQGRGDRRPRADWTHVSTVPDLVILEGWMLGFTSVPEDHLPNVHFKVINQFLERYQTWYRHCDGFLQLKADDFRFVLDWRVEAEEKMRAAGHEGMSREEVRRYAELFMPAYATYLPWLETHPPIEGKPHMIVPIARTRLSGTPLLF